MHVDTHTPATGKVSVWRGRVVGNQCWRSLLATKSCKQNYKIQISLLVSTDPILPRKEKKQAGIETDDYLSLSSLEKGAGESTDAILSSSNKYRK